jgi:hypothetical protein
MNLNVNLKNEAHQFPEEWKKKRIGDYAFITKLAGFEYTKYFVTTQPDATKSGK